MLDFHEEARKALKKEKLARRILGVKEHDGPDTIKKAFWLLAMKYHPDKNPTDREAERRFQNIVNAYDYLMKGRRRGAVLEDLKREDKENRRRGDFNVENVWGYYLWWRDSFFNERYGVSGAGSRRSRSQNTFDDVDPHGYEAWYQTPVGKRIAGEEKSTIMRLLGEDRGRLLDVGCGTGYFTQWFVLQGFKVVGLDIAGPLLRYAAKHTGTMLVHGNGACMPFRNDLFQTAVGIAVLEFARFPERIIKEMCRVSKNKLLLLMLNPQSELNKRRRERSRGPFSSARFWEPESASLFLRDLLPESSPRSVYREIHNDFYVLLYRRRG
jgi:curved DNA-binding protein CbpA